MKRWLSAEEARKYLDLPSTIYLDNYAKGGELVVKRSGGEVTFSRDELDRWKKERRIFPLDKRDYTKCLHYAIGSLYKYCSIFGCATRNSAELAKVVDSFMVHKLGEAAFQKFMDEKFKVIIKFDVEFHEAVVSQEIAEIALPGKWFRVYNPPEKIGLSVKAIEMRESWLIVPEHEVENRRHHPLIDVYVVVRVGLPSDHLFRVLGEITQSRLGVKLEETTLSHFNYLEADIGILSDEIMIPQLEDVQAQIVGYAWLSELLDAGVQPGVPDHKVQPGYYLPTGKLRRGDVEWEKLIELI